MPEAAQLATGQSWIQTQAGSSVHRLNHIDCLSANICVSDIRSITYKNGFSNPPIGVFGSAKVNIGESVCNPVIYGMRWGSETISTPDWF